MQEYLNDLRAGGRPMTRKEKLEQENTQLKSVLKEIREYINNSTTRMETLNYQISDLTKKELLEIIDKGIGEDK